MRCRLRIAISWLLIGVATHLVFFEDSGQFIGSIFIVPLILLRNTKEDRSYWNAVGSAKNPVVIGVFIWMLCWLAYLLYQYFQAKPVGTHRLGETQLIAFLLPGLLMFAYYEFKWLAVCNKHEKA